MANKFCPICGEENKCEAGAGEHGSCWCNKETFPKGVFELVPEESRNKHCICKSCLSKYKEQIENI
ncbi:cysteine-rich CWC family protein [Bacillus marasmi]|uniref:cysteine-rich CWC family protein n=1 Tax=Bacillus marasmi TaxID=1926279 RepID=UPI0011C93953|nr:cysteine-rich CWC family protein [Bacillus marasmi]